LHDAKNYGSFSLATNMYAPDSLVSSAVCKLKGYTVSNIYIREDLFPAERQKCRERFGTLKVAAASDHMDSHCPPQS